MPTLKDKARKPRSLSYSHMPVAFPEYKTKTDAWDDKNNAYVNIPAMEVRTKGNKDALLKIETPRPTKIK